ncbi:MAG: siroheme synthase CysG [Pseudomonadota bacterium]
MSLRSPQNKLSLVRRRKRPDRVQPLASLPVFYKLAGRPVLLAGGSDAAAWKAELLAATGATVHVYAEELDDEFDAIIAASPASFVLHDRPWATDAFTGMAVAIADAESEGEAQAFLCAGRAAGVPVNVIDKPAFCEFQFGSIVNRSPAIVSISTDGAAPIFGQAIRRRIETLLPPSVKDWAQLAQSIRPKVNARFAMGAPRRAFWERFVDRAFSGAEASLDSLFEAEATGGKVTLVGAGPGDAELLTMKAIRALQAADVILFDDLVSDEVLELARREAKRMLVGKRGGRESCKQEDINATMVQLAKEGRNVVRLKSGDPTIFGRAGEEIAELERHGIPVSIVPGITSASALAAQLNVSLTHRDHAQSVRYVTGHSRHGRLPELDWKGIADPKATTVFYMGGRTAKEIEAELIEQGLGRDTPVVIVANISRSNERRWTGRLADLGTGIDIVGTQDPVLVAIGSCLSKPAAVKADTESSRLSQLA